MGSSRLVAQLKSINSVLTPQRLSAASNLGLIVVAAYMVASLFWHLVPGAENKGVITPAAISNSANTSTKQINLQPLLSLDLFGKVQKQPVAVAKPIVNKAAPKTRLNVKLTGLVADNTDPYSNTSVAIIDSAGGQNTYGINEKIDGTSASVYQILIDRVILAVNNQYETLMLDGIEYSTTIPGSDNKVEKPAAQEPAAVTARKEQLDKREDVDLSQSLRQQREQLFSDPKKLTDLIRIRPMRKQGQLIGYRLSPGKNPQLFQQVGLKHNDLAININGYDLTDMQQALSVMKELKTMTEATITVLRGDTSVDIILAL